jgi:hypothetical protein
MMLAKFIGKNLCHWKTFLVRCYLPQGYFRGDIFFPWGLKEISNDQVKFRLSA